MSLSIWLSWSLLVLTVIAYAVKRKRAANERCNLTAFAAAVLLSDEYRTAMQQGITGAIRATPASINGERVISGILTAVGQLSRKHAPTNHGVNSLAVVARSITTIRSVSNDARGQ